VADASRAGRPSPITAAGLAVLVIGVAAWIGAAFLGWDELAAVAAVATVALIAAALWAVGRPRLQVELMLDPKRVDVGGSAVARIHVTNIAARRMRPLRMEVTVGKAVAGVGIGTLKPGGTRSEWLPIPTPKRAVIPVGPVTSVRGDPLGLMRREVTWTGRYTLGVEELFVHARTVDVRSLTAGRVRDLEGDATNQRSPHDIAFHSLREYVPGDDLRHVHWRTTARQVRDDQLMVREFVDTRRTSLALLLSLRDEDYASADEFELAASVIASIGRRCLHDQEELVFVAGAAVQPSVGYARFADAVSRIELGGSDAAPATIARFAGRVSGRASVVVLVAGSGAQIPELRAATDQLDANVHPVVVRTNLGAESTFHMSRGTALIELGSLEDLPRLVRMVGAG
jgi:uncharacterized protein (DUF58 family)